MLQSDQRVWKGRRRLTDLPYPRFWGFLVWFLKSFEVLFFKWLQWMDLYRAQKSIVGIPSLAAPNSTSLQAVVYNGTQEEVLGYRPRRVLHRLLKGLPDLEFFERVRFQLSLSERSTRTVEASTETRGFVHLQVPWQLPWHAPGKAWLRMTPLGVETLFGRMSLGDYEIFSSPVFFLTDDIKWVILSDIDDTIKDSRIGETTGFKQIVSGLFRGHFYTYEAIQGMAEMYQRFAEKGALIIYVTSTPYPLAPFLLKFLRERGFPEGPVFMRWLGYGQFRHKWRTLHRILSSIEKQKCCLIGDSGEQDLLIYRRLYDTERFRGRIAKILIRHVAGTPLLKTLGEHEQYYHQISELDSIVSKLME